MTYKDLRLGNWLLFRDKRYCKVSNLGFFFATESNEVTYGSDDITDYNPIPLTHEILVKAGFKKHDKFNHDYRHANGLRVCMVSNGGFKLITYLFDLDKEPDCNHVHQLQNLYFALTGEELNIQL